MSKGVINSITLDKTIVLENEKIIGSVNYTSSTNETLNTFVGTEVYTVESQNICKKDTNGNIVLLDDISTDDVVNGNKFGYSVAIDGNYAIVGAIDTQNFRGSAYIFKKNNLTWTQTTELLSANNHSDMAMYTSFAFSVAISGDYAIVGAYSTGTFASGKVYIFKKDNDAETWTEWSVLTPDSDTATYQFGYSVAIDGDYLIVGAPAEDSKKGAAYIFKNNGSSWTQQEKLTASDGADDDEFGNSVAISGIWAIVGAPDENSKRGAAYIFKKDNGAETWAQQKKLTASDGAANDFFGHSVAISGGDYAIIGAYGVDVNNKQNAGAAYIFKSDSTVQGDIIWRDEEPALQKKLTISDGAYNDRFGHSVAIDGDYVIVGAKNEDSDKGTAYIFKATNDETVGFSSTDFFSQQILLADDRSEQDRFGYSVAISGNHAIIGEPGFTTDTKGAVYIFPVSMTDTVSQGTANTTLLLLTLQPNASTFAFNNLKVNSNNWTGVTGSDYFLINSHSGEGSGIANNLYNEFINIQNSYYTAGSGTSYSTGSGVGYTSGFATGSGDGFNAGSELPRSANITVHAGWNMFSPEKSGTINDTDNIIIDHTLQYFNGTSYETRIGYNELQEGKGYMVKCKESGSFTINFH